VIQLAKPRCCTSMLYGTFRRLLVDTSKLSDLGALGGTRTPNLLIRSSGQVVQDRPVVSALWADVPGLSSRADSWLRPWQQLEHLLAKIVRSAQ
jgi:hypothetical protein